MGSTRSDLPLPLQEELNTVESTCQGLLDEFLASLVGPDTIYHYTDERGLDGILRTGVLWLSDIFRMNDAAELSYSFATAVTAMTRKALREAPEMRFFADHLSGFALRGGIEKSAHYFMCSFSAEGDDWSQWDSYAAAGRGFALAFDTVELGSMFASAGNADRMDRLAFPITYDDPRAEALQSRIVDLIAPLVLASNHQRISVDQIRSYWRELSTIFCVYGLGFAALFKGEARWRTEREFRFLEVYPIGSPPPSTRLRRSKRGDTKYVELNWLERCPAALRHIVVGPKADPDVAKRALDAVSHKISHVTIIRSNARYP